MFPGGLADAEAQLWLFLLAMLRPGAAFLAAPVFGAANVPVQVRVILSLGVGIPALAAAPFAMPPDGLASAAGVLLVAGEVIAGLALGFAVQLGYAAAMMGGEVIGNAMGLGFASLIDPASDASSPAVGQFLSILGTFLFLAMGGHLALAAIVIDSYRSLPPGQAWLGQGTVHSIVMFGGDMIAAGMAIALPVGFALILVQVVMGMLARSAPAMNLFSVGLPATLFAGIVLMAIAAPALGEGIATAIARGLALARSIAGGAADMAEESAGEKTEASTAKHTRDAVEQGDVLQSKDLGTALVVLVGAAWLALGGPYLLQVLGDLLRGGLSFDRRAIVDFEPGATVLAMLIRIALPLATLFAATIVAAVGTPAMLGALGFRWSALAFKGQRINPLAGLKRIFGPQGLVELGKALAKVTVLGLVGWWLLSRRLASLTTMGRGDINAAMVDLGHSFVFAVLVMAGGLVVIASVDVPAQLIRRSNRLKMTKQEVKDESKQTEGSPEAKGAVRRRQMETARRGARAALAEASVVLTNPTHFAVALRYRPGEDVAPIVVARGRGVTADAIRALAAEHEVPTLRYPQLTRALYFTTRAGQVIREDLYVAVATVLAFVFNIERAMADGTPQPEVEVPGAVRFDENGRVAG